MAQMIILTKMERAPSLTMVGVAARGARTLLSSLPKTRSKRLDAVTSPIEPFQTGPSWKICVNKH